MLSSPCFVCAREVFPPVPPLHNDRAANWQHHALFFLSWPCPSRVAELNFKGFSGIKGSRGHAKNAFLRQVERSR